MRRAAGRTLAATAAAVALMLDSSLASAVDECRAPAPARDAQSPGTVGNILLQRKTRHGVVVLGDEDEDTDWWGDEATPAPAPPSNATNTPLRKAALAHGLLVGTTLVYSMDEEYERVATAHFNLAEPESACGWASIRPTPGTFDFTACDTFVKFAKGKMNATFRGPSLVWGEHNPTWVEALAEPALKRNAMVEHVTEVIRHYGNQSYSWDVVREAITDNASATDPFKNAWSFGAATKDHPWYPDVSDYLDMAFMAARLAGGPSQKLLYSDYNIMSCAEGHWMKAKSDRVYELVEGMVKRGIPIDGVATQMPLELSWAEPSLFEGTRSNFARYDKLGLEVHVTGLDVASEVWSEKVEAQQAKLYAELLNICLESPACKSFSTRGFTDKASVRGFDKYPLPFDAIYKPKAALYSMVRALLSKPASVPVDNATLAANGSSSNRSSSAPNASANVSVANASKNESATEENATTAPSPAGRS